MVLKLIITIFFLLSSVQAETDEQKCLQCKQPANYGAIDFLAGDVDSMKSFMACQNYKEGESRLFSRTGGPAGDYVIKKVPGGYQAIININFVANTPGVSTTTMMSRVKSCLNESNKVLKGPNGEKLEIIPLTPSEAKSSIAPSQYPNQTDIKLSATTAVTDARHYPMNVNCMTITHEILHLLGLCDEYSADKAPNGPQTSCRVDVPMLSIMKYAPDFYPLTQTQTLTCDCRSGTCPSVMKSASEKIKKLYLGKNYYFLTDATFRSNCKETKTSTTESAINNPYVIKSSNDKSLSFENFFVDTTKSGYDLKKASVTCSCSSEDRNCLYTLDKIRDAAKKYPSSTQCPYGASSSPGAPVGVDGKITNGILTIVVPPQEKSLLSPNQFARIINSSCGAGAQYNQCADLAYIPLSSPSCNPEIRKKCMDTKYFLGR